MVGQSCQLKRQCCGPTGEPQIFRRFDGACLIDPQTFLEFAEQVKNPPTACPLDLNNLHDTHFSTDTYCESARLIDWKN